MIKPTHAIAAALAAGALAVAGCGGNDSKSSSSSSKPAAAATDASMTDATASGAAELRATLTAGLQAHVYEAADAIVAGVSEGLDSKQFKAAAATLDANSVDLSDAIGSVYGDAAGKQFLALWRKHIGFFVDYTKAKASKDDAGAEKAKAALDGYRADFGAFLASANPNLTKEAVADELKPHVASLFKVIDDLVAGKGSLFDDLKVAAGHMSMTADVLAGAIAKQYPDKFAGNADSGASELRSTLTAGLQEHVFLAGIAVAQGVGQGLDSAQFKAAATTLDANSVDLSKAIGSVYGDAAGKQFLALWRKHIGFFVDYTKAKASKDDAGAEKAKAALDGYRADFGAFLASANPNLTKEAVADELTPHVQTLFDTIDAVVAGDTSLYDKLDTSADHMPMTAEILAGAIAKQFPDKFSGA